MSTAPYRELPGTHRTIAARWSYTGPAPLASRVAADGCFDLIVRRPACGPAAAFVYAPVTAAHHASIADDAQLFGVRIRPGYGATLCADPALLIAARRLADDAPLDALDALDALEALEALVVSAIDAHRSPPPVVLDFVATARSESGALRLTSHSAARERELQRACRRWLGLTPKEFLRIERAWAARASIRAGAPLALVAAERGYSDQAHLTRELRALLGVTPTQLRPVGILQYPSELHR